VIKYFYGAPTRSRASGPESLARVSFDFGVLLALIQCDHLSQWRLILFRLLALIMRASFAFCNSPLWMVAAPAWLTAETWVCGINIDKAITIISHRRGGGWLARRHVCADQIPPQLPHGMDFSVVKLCGPSVCRRHGSLPGAVRRGLAGVQNPCLDEQSRHPAGH